jgi:hypothetical protein
VWITLLAIKNRHGEVAGSIPGLANIANVSLAACERALVKLESPDRYSRTKDNQGRRIATIDGGWRILNHAVYQDMMSAAERKAYKAQWAKENRAKQAKERGQKCGQSRQNGDSAGTPVSVPVHEGAKTRKLRLPKGWKEPLIHDPALKPEHDVVAHDKHSRHERIPVTQSRHYEPVESEAF